ncbi:PLP-dependent aminotransferase family protein [Herbidospora galbida]|uniref:PLP-dependent aminotransferase family protein n=1 Tax=Herbidospora galbida TaxID=2575442 RepID=A0A4U3M1U2_9ACTN|nr:PLP-dependent aminotransferase family protein [Herbidospora galbida]TKK81216.1 PLP-dependent aminotransferase family protein [Herbidospora galbida]
MNDDSSIARLADSLKAQAASLRPGDRLPSSREIVQAHGVSPVTVSKAVARLVAEGVVTTRPGAGAFVAAPPRPRETDPSWQTVALGGRVVDEAALTSILQQPAEGVIPLTGGYLNPVLRPTKELGAAAIRAVKRPDAWSMPPRAGVPELRTWFAGETETTQNDVLIVSGGQAALTHAFRGLAAPGDPVLVETPTYPGALATARAAGLRVVPVPADDGGVRPDQLAEAFARTGARVFYCQPTLQNPSGATQSLERRRQVLDIARAAGAFVVEDDFARYLTTTPPPPPLVALDTHGTVVHVLSLSKITAPSLRVAGLVARGPAAARLRAAQIVESFFVARPLQETALEFVSAPAWRRHRAAVAAELDERRGILLESLRRHLPDLRVELVPKGGLHVWVRLPPALDEPALVERAQRAGVLVSPGRIYHATEPPGPWLRLTHTAASHRAELAEGVIRLATAYGELAADAPGASSAGRPGRRGS